jgi:hypothetical protein
MIERLATAMSPWTYSPQPVVSIAARATFIAITSLYCLIPLIGIAFVAVVVLLGFSETLKRVFLIFMKYCFGGPSTPKDIIGHIPDTLILPCTPDQFEQKYVRANDLQVSIGLPWKAEDLTTTPLPGALDLPEALALICRFLHLADYQRFSMTSKQTYIFCNDTFERIYNREYFSKYLNLEISEELFKTTKTVHKFTAYFFICKKLCWHPVINRSSRYYSPYDGPNFPRHLIEQIGPFTFLSIPYVASFMTPAQHPIERTSETQGMRLRLRMKIGNQTVVQVIEQRSGGWGSSYNSHGLWSRGLILQKIEFDFLISLLKNPQGAQISEMLLHLSRETFPVSRNPQVNGYTMMNIHAVLDPPLSSLKQ